MTLPDVMWRTRLALCIVVACVAALPALPTRAQAAPPRIVAGFSILADMTRELAPAGAEVTSLVGPNADAHVFEPSPADGRHLAQADLVVVNGLNFEGWVDRLIKVSGYRGPVVVASRGLKLPPSRTPHEGNDRKGHDHHGAVDPHAWQNLAYARIYVANISSALAARWPERQAEIESRRVAYLARVDELDRRVRDSLNTIPRDQRRVITSHDAFGHFGAAYCVDFLAPQGWDTHSEPSAAAVARLIRQIRQQGVRAVFIENISDPRLVERIAQEAGVRVGGTLYSDALSLPGGPADTYLKLIEHNARTLVDTVSTPR
jgi:zinc/manganese transport system substrate-binding protein